MRRSARVACLFASVLASGVARDALAGQRTKVVVLDDGVKVVRDGARAMEGSPWGEGTIDLFALRGETIAIQVVVDAGDAPADDVRVLVEPFVDDDGARLHADVSQFVERFVVVERASGNDRAPGSLAFTAESAPRASLLSAIADALVPVAYETAHAEPHQRAAVWIDLDVPGAARAATYASALLVRDARGELTTRPLVLRVIDAALPYAAAPAFAYYDTRELRRRMGDTRAEEDLRALFHAHRLAAIHDVGDAMLGDERAIDLDRASLTGEAYARDKGYAGAGADVGDGVFALGAYGSLGAPSASSADVASRLVREMFPPKDDAFDARPGTATFLYAVDEDCGSPWPAEWSALLHARTSMRDVRIGATCGRDPVSQDADLVMQSSPDFDPARARVARERRDQWVWAYNGRRPSAGAMMLDVPATDLRANAWIAMRYGVPRWFYWESTFWFDDDRGGSRTERGLDPFVVAETFHNADGDHANGDGILVYPGTQRPDGMIDYRVSTVFPSVRLKNLRRGIEDAGYVVLARAVDPERTDAVVRRMIPRALAFAGPRVAWPENARAWLDARRELAAIASAPRGADDLNGERVSDGCAVAPSSGASSDWGASAGVWTALFIGCTVVPRARRRTRALNRMRHRRDEHGE
jgi:hypothetical protein